MEVHLPVGESGYMRAHYRVNGMMFRPLKRVREEPEPDAPEPKRTPPPTEPTPPPTEPTPTTTTAHEPCAATKTTTTEAELIAKDSVPDYPYGDPTGKQRRLPYGNQLKLPGCKTIDDLRRIYNIPKAHVADRPNGTFTVFPVPHSGFYRYVRKYVHKPTGEWDCPECKATGSSGQTQLSKHLADERHFACQTVKFNDNGTLTIVNGLYFVHPPIGWKLGCKYV